MLSGRYSVLSVLGEMEFFFFSVKILKKFMGQKKRLCETFRESCFANMFKCSPPPNRDSTFKY